jgi:hypothetical protein
MLSTSTAFALCGLVLGLYGIGCIVFRQALARYNRNRSGWQFVLTTPMRAAIFGLIVTAIGATQVVLGVTHVFG